jgi:hypothetical protein
MDVRARYDCVVNLVDELHAIAAALEAAGVPYAVCGGIAVTIHGATRTTKDIDILVRRPDVARALDAVRPLGFVYAALPLTFEAGTPRERHVQRVSKLEGGQHLMLELLIEEAALAGFLARRIALDLPEGRLSVITLDALVEMKRLANRPQDQADIEKLESGDDDG